MNSLLPQWLCDGSVVELRNVVEHRNHLKLLLHPVTTFGQKGLSSRRKSPTGIAANNKAQLRCFQKQVERSVPVMITSSPSCRNLRTTPFPRSRGLVPLQDSSSILPYESSVWRKRRHHVNAILLLPARGGFLSEKLVQVLTAPLMVPDASRSPGRTLHPLTVWCANCCFIVQYMYYKPVRFRFTLPRGHAK